MIFSSQENKKNKEETPEQKAARELSEKASREFKIVSMPEKYRSEKAAAGQTKKVGVVIFSGGIFLLLITGGALVYFYFFYKTNTNLSLDKISNLIEKNASSSQIVEAQAPALIAPIEDNASSSGEVMATSSNETMVSTTTAQENVSNILSVPDQDNDSLSDQEEGLLGTDYANRDSDGDGYNDYVELLNLYNPSGSGNLSGSSNIKIFRNPGFNYSMHYPSLWTASSVGGDDSVVFNSSDNHFIQVVAQANSGVESIESWYRKQFTDEELNQAEKVSFDGWDGLKNPETGAYYLTDKSRRNYIYSITYTPATDNQLLYQKIFEMMIRSFTIGK
jgi:hypothetical protein